MARRSRASYAGRAGDHRSGAGRTGGGMAQHGRHSGRARRRHLGIVGLFAGVIHRGASTVLILLVALIASAAASTGPAYYTSAKTSILRDTFANASYVERGVEVTLQGA